MVDGIAAFTLDPAPRIETRRLISITEPVFEAHFPDLPMWPGVYTIEACAQTTHLLYALEALARGRFGEEADPAKEMMRTLRLASAALRLQPSGSTPGAALLESTPPTFGLLAHADVKLVSPVFAGDTLWLEAAHRERFGEMFQVDVQARVGSQAVARGTLTVARQAR